MEPIHKINKVEVRNLQMEDYAQLSQSFKRVYADADVFWTREQIKKLIAIFPEGQIVTVVDNKIVGCALSIIVDYDMVKGDHTYAKVTGNETFNTHNPKGNILYGIEVFIHPEYRGLRLARRMYEYRKELCEKLNLKAIMFGGRIPNYHKYADKMRPKEYIEKSLSQQYKEHWEKEHSAMTDTNTDHIKVGKRPVRMCLKRIGGMLLAIPAALLLWLPFSLVEWIATGKNERADRMMFNIEKLAK